MGWDALARIARQGIDVGAHTRRHSDLTRLTGDELADEVIGSAERIGSELGALPSAFAYPYGRTNPAVTATVRKTFELACTTELRFLAANEERALLPRLDAYYLRGTGQLEAWGTAAFRGRLWVRAQGRRVRQLMGNAGAHR
jgi:peptidoglycan/xylan/chitin deacetylase (PgdA/CDA1 family)